MIYHRINEKIQKRIDAIAAETILEPKNNTSSLYPKNCEVTVLKYSSVLHRLVKLLFQYISYFPYFTKVKNRDTETGMRGFFFQNYAYYIWI